MQLWRWLPVQEKQLNDHGSDGWVLEPLQAHLFSLSFSLQGLAQNDFVFKWISFKYNTLELFHSNGLGILEISQESTAIVPAEEDKKSELRDLFALLSEQMLIRFQLHSLLAERHSQLDEISNSGSWKITSGLRTLFRIFLEIRDSLKKFQASLT